MSNEDKNIYLNRQRERYRELVSRREKSIMILEVMGYLSISRDHAIRCLNGKSRIRGQNSGPKIEYGPEIIPYLKKLYFITRQPCSKRLCYLMSEWLPFYEKHYGVIPDEMRFKLLKISPATVDRLLKPIRAQRGIGTTKAPDSKWYKAHIPIRPKDWNIQSPGHFQGDTVSHCGNSAAGLFASTLTLTDIDSGWTENRSFLTKESSRVREALESIENKLLFTIKSIKFDSGSEFMNYGVISFLKSTLKRPERIEVFRSRPYRKNDNCYVEQKNFTHVRELFGYDRIDQKQIVDLMNEIYINYWNPLQNHFLPQMKILRKERIGAKIKKIYDKPKSPYQRLLESSELYESQKHTIREIHASLDPIELQLGLEAKLKVFYELMHKANLSNLNAA